MCGIAGQLGDETNETFTDHALELLARRGPDSNGHLRKAGSGLLVHTRLAIIDLSKEGGQPMSDPAGRFTIIFNGEIYNHGLLRPRAESLGWSFRSRSDTEVLLAWWVLFGEQGLQDLFGMFAFCIVDWNLNEAFLVRDRFGVKPLYIRRHSDRVEFSSTPEVLVARHEHREFNLEYLSRGLNRRSYESDDCLRHFSAPRPFPRVP